MSITYPEGYEDGSDPLLEEWILKRYSPNAAERVLVAYEPRQECRITAGDLVNKQGCLPDRRFLRVNSFSPETKGDVSTSLIRVERPRSSDVHRNIVRVDRVNYDHVLLILPGWNRLERVKRPLDIFGALEEPMRKGDRYICWVNSGAETADELQIQFESKCPPLDPNDGLA